MASLTVPASFLGSAAGVGRKSPASRRRLSVPRAESQEAAAPCSSAHDSKSSGGRRGVMLAVAAAAAVSAVGAGARVDAVALTGERKPGSPEAKKKYAAICVTMPTASVCRK